MGEGQRRPCADACAALSSRYGRSPAGRVRYVQISADAGGVHPPQLLLELADLVPQTGRQLEVQLPRGLVHLVLELLDELRQLGTRHPGEVLRVRADGALRR